MSGTMRTGVIVGPSMAIDCASTSQNVEAPGAQRRHALAARPASRNISRAPRIPSRAEPSMKP